MNEADWVQDGWPRLALVRQQFPPSPVLDIAATLPSQLQPLLAGLKPGARVAVAVGSRGITGLKTVVATAIDTLQRAGASPFVVPAMGSHGGGTSDGQLALLAEYGVTTQALGVPFLAGMEVRAVGTTSHGLEVCLAEAALQADGILIINRIKPHTDFSGGLGSGLFKMLVVGLGKAVGAARYHAAASRWGYEPVLRAAARLASSAASLLGGVAIVEDQRHQTASLTVVPPADFERCEAALCLQAKALMPRLPFDDLDLLIVDRLGKNISGTGMDPAVIGRSIHGYSLAPDPGHPPPRVRRLLVRDLTPESHGNAIGVGLADFTTTRLVRAIDWKVTMLNSLTALSLQGAKLPIHFESDQEAIGRALKTLALPAIHRAKVVRIADTLSLERFEASEAALETPAPGTVLTTERAAATLSFDATGNLHPCPE